MRPEEALPSVEAIDPAFGHWLAGFIDGEGCFSIISSQRAIDGLRHYSCRFGIQVREDDLPVLLYVASATGLGKVVRRNPPSRLPSKPLALWQVITRRDCLGMVQILDRFPLRAKKARDYAIWREAVIEWRLIERGPIERNRAHWARLAELRAGLAASHRYVEPRHVEDVPKYGR